MKLVLGLRMQLDALFIRNAETVCTVPRVVNMKNAYSLSRVHFSH